ncbi:Rpn family recombination-promoting nuclease/putative transposase [Nannocystaceae bacterium ST9]
MTHRPHDSLFKSAFRQPENAAALARCHLPSSIDAQIRWSTMALVSGSFVDQTLADRHSDLLFEVETEIGRTFVYLLFEHQSSNHPRMPLRMLVYMVRIWERFADDHESALPPIIPFLICHTPDGWTSPRRFHELFTPLLEQAPELMQFVPDFRMLIDDLEHASDEELSERALAAFAKITLWLLRDGRHPSRFVTSMSNWVRGLDELVGAPNGLAALHSVVRYITLVRNDQMTWDAFRANLHELAPAAEPKVMTLAEKWFNEGKAEGKAEGLTLMLSKQLALKFGELPLDARARLASASLDELDLWAERVLAATTLAEVFAEPAR